VLLNYPLVYSIQNLLFYIIDIFSKIWQLNENWPTGGWGIFEYSSGRGQIQGGRWKPLAYVLMRSLFRDIIVSCNAVGQCFCRNDGIQNVSVSVHITFWDLFLDEKEKTIRRNIFLEGGFSDTGKARCLSLLF
jgi:hypothetical protein